MGNGLGPEIDAADVAERASEIAQRNAGKMVTALTAASRRRVRSLTEQALDRGWTEATLAQRLQATVGLSTPHAKAVETYRQALLDQGIPSGRATAQADAYAKRLQRSRGKTIARTEMQQANAQAQRELWQEAQEDGLLSNYAVRVTHTKSGACPMCRVENGRRRTLRTTVDGPPFHPNCRCYETVSDQGTVVAE